MSQKVDASLNKKITDRIYNSKITETTNFIFFGKCEQAIRFNLLLSTFDESTDNINFTIRLFLDDGLLDTVVGTISAQKPISGPSQITILNIPENIENSIKNADRYTLEITFNHSGTDYTPIVRMTQIYSTADINFYGVSNYYKREETTSKDIYVSTTGLDQIGRGSFTAPFKTFFYAIDSIMPYVNQEATINIFGFPGTYQEKDLGKVFRKINTQLSGLINIKPVSGQEFIVVDSGTMTSNVYFKHTNTAKTLTPNEHKGMFLKNLASGEIFPILNNTVDTYTTGGSTTYFTVNITNYEIIDFKVIINAEEDYIYLNENIHHPIFENIKINGNVFASTFEDTFATLFKNCSINSPVFYSLKNMKINKTFVETAMTSLPDSTFMSFSAFRGDKGVKCLLCDNTAIEPKTTGVKNTPAIHTNTGVQMTQQQLYLNDFYIKDFKYGIGNDNAGAFAFGAVNIADQYVLENVDFTVKGFSNLIITNDPAFPVYSFGTPNIGNLTLDGTTANTQYINLVKVIFALIFSTAKYFLHEDGRIELFKVGNTTIDSVGNWSIIIDSPNDDLSFERYEATGWVQKGFFSDSLHTDVLWLEGSNPQVATYHSIGQKWQIIRATPDGGINIGSLDGPTYQENNGNNINIRNIETFLDDIELSIADSVTTQLLEFEYTTDKIGWLKQVTLNTDGLVNMQFIITLLDFPLIQPFKFPNDFDFNAGKGFTYPAGEQTFDVILPWQFVGGLNLKFGFKTKTDTTYYGNANHLGLGSFAPRLTFAGNKGYFEYIKTTKEIKDKNDDFLIDSSNVQDYRNGTLTFSNTISKTLTFSDNVFNINDEIDVKHFATSGDLDIVQLGSGAEIEGDSSINLKTNSSVKLKYLGNNKWRIFGYYNEKQRLGTTLGFGYYLPEVPTDCILANTVYKVEIPFVTNGQNNFIWDSIGKKFIYKGRGEYLIFTFNANISTSIANNTVTYTVCKNMAPVLNILKEEYLEANLKSGSVSVTCFDYIAYDDEIEICIKSEQAGAEIKTKNSALVMPGKL